MLFPDVEFEITTGDLTAYLRSALSRWSGLTVAVKRPETMPQRLLTVRDDAGPPVGVGLILNRYGINAWTDDPVEAEQLVRDAIYELRLLPGVGPFKATRDFFGPTEIEDDPPFTFGETPLSHFYASFAAVVKGTSPTS